MEGVRVCNAITQEVRLSQYSERTQLCNKRQLKVLLKRPKLYKKKCRISFLFFHGNMSESEIGTGKTVFVIAVVLGCFAILYPKIFYHMMFDKERSNGKTETVRPGW